VAEGDNVGLIDSTPSLLAQHLRNVHDRDEEIVGLAFDRYAAEFTQRCSATGARTEGDG